MSGWTKVERGIVMRDRVYYVRFEVNGKTVTEATKARSIVQARAERAIRQGRVHDDRHVPADKRRLTIGHLLDGLLAHWKTAGDSGGPIETYFARAQQLESLRQAVGAHRAREWTYQHAATFVAKGTTPGQRCTRSSRMAMLKAAFAVAKRDNLVQVIPSFPPRIDNVREGFIEPEDFERYVEEGGFSPLDAQILRFTYRTGQRISRILNLHVTDIDTVGWMMKAERERGTKQRPMVPLLGIARIIAEDRIKAASGPGWLLFHRDGQRISRYAIRHKWNAAMKRRGLPWTIHDFRRSCARNLVNAGVHPLVAAEITGQSLAIFKRYAIKPDVAIRQGAQQLENYLTDRLSAQATHIPMDRDANSLTDKDKMD